jgi:hypothetical protein
MKAKNQTVVVNALQKNRWPQQINATINKFIFNKQFHWSEMFEPNDLSAVL